MEEEVGVIGSEKGKGVMGQRKQVAFRAEKNP